MATDPAGIQLALRATSEGCRWLISRWQNLRNALESDRWTESDLQHALDLLGLPRPSRESNTRARAWTARQRAVRRGDPEAPTALDTLLRHIDRQINGLDARARLLWKNVEAADYAALAQGVAFLPTANRRLLNRYENTASRSLARAQSLLKNLRNDHADQLHSPQPDVSTSPPARTRARSDTSRRAGQTQPPAASPAWL